MDFVRCEKGHFYDASQNAACPVCVVETAGDMGVQAGPFAPIGAAAPIGPGQNVSPIEPTAPVAGPGFPDPFYVTSVNGSNIIRVNEEPVLSSAELHPYDILIIGTSKLCFVPFCGDKFSWTD